MSPPSRTEPILLLGTSAHHTTLLMVVEPGTWTVKWQRVGPWLRQHDPDFEW